MIMLIDSHCHPHLMDLSLFDEGVKSIVNEAKNNGVEIMLAVSTDLKDFPKLKEMSEQFKEIYISVGLHPNEISDNEPTVDDLLQYAAEDRVIAIGETGLDYYREYVDAKTQKQRFRTHIQAAKEIKKPLIIHTRDAKEDIFKILKEEKADQIGGVFHCFTGDWEMAQAALEFNFYISFSGIVTFPKALEIQDVAKKVPHDKFLIETDSPYLAPAPFRGKPNQPAYVRYVAEHLAKLRDSTFETIAQQSTENFFECFPHSRL